MLAPITRSNAVGWQFIDNEIAVRSTKVPSVSKSKPSKTIRRRTRILNQELKNFVRINSYSQYVKIKTSILREVSDDESVREDSPEKNRVAEIQSSPEAISLPGPSDKKTPRTRKGKKKSAKGQGGKHDHEAKSKSKIQNRSKAKKNLSRMLENVDKANPIADQSKTVQNVDKDVSINNSTISWRVPRKSRTPIANVPLGDSGIDDNSQANSSTSNHENDGGVEVIGITEVVDRLAEESDDLPSVFTQADKMALATEFSQSHLDRDELEEPSDEEKEAEELSQNHMNDDENEESMLRNMTMEKSSQSNVNDDEINECPSGDEKTGKSSGSDREDDKIENTLTKEKVEKFCQSDDDDVKESLTKKVAVAKHSSSDIDGDVIEKSLAKKKKVEQLPQSDENEDEIEKASPEEESAPNASQFDDTNDDGITESWTKEENVETFPHSDTNDDSFKRKNQPTIMCTEIVTSKYKIIRDENETEKDVEKHLLEPETVENNEPTESDELSTEADRVSKLKRINLLCSGTESDSSEEGETMKQTNVQTFTYPPLSSQMISDASDSEDSDSLALHITDSEDGKVTSTPYSKQQRNEALQSRGFIKKSIKDQIKEQTISDSSARVGKESVDNTEEEEEEQVNYAGDEENASLENHSSEITEKINADRPKRKKRSKKKLYATETLQSVSNNLSERNTDDENPVEACSRKIEENPPNQGFIKKSIKDQIKEQTITDLSARVEEESVDKTEEKEQVDNAGDEENASRENHSSEVTEKINADKPKRKKRSKKKLSETETRQPVSNNLSERNTDDENPVEACSQEVEENPTNQGFIKNSIKDRIKEQTIIDSSARVEEESVNNTEEEEQVDNVEDEETACPQNHSCEVTEKKDEGRPKRKKRNKEKSFESETLKYVSNNLSRRSSDAENLVEACSQKDEENLPRPTELHEVVEREDLIPANTSSTITLKDLSKISKSQDDDEQIWFMEIPKSIVTNPGLCGQRMVIQKNQITIGDINYNVTLQHTKPVSCILREHEKKPRYKAVNIRPVYSINVRHKCTETEECIPSKRSPPQKVPFPKNIKSRNPLIVENKARLSSSENTDPLVEKEKKKRQSTKKRKKVLWHMDNFILKPKRKKIDGSWINGSKEADLFNE